MKTITIPITPELKADIEAVHKCVDDVCERHDDIEEQAKRIWALVHAQRKILHPIMVQAGLEE